MCPRLLQDGSGTRRLQLLDMVTCTVIFQTPTTTELSRELLWETTLKLQFTSNTDDKYKSRHNNKYQIGIKITIKVEISYILD